MRWRRRGPPTSSDVRAARSGPLHGVPVGIKDIIDTADMPTENGSVLHAGRTPSRDAPVVSLLRARGRGHHGQDGDDRVRHPHARQDAEPARSRRTRRAARRAARPRRSAASMVPLALGSQTTGSTIRPASYCGVYGFKPTHGLIPRHGMFQLSRTLDHVGLFARTIEDIALLLEAARGLRRARSRLAPARPRCPIAPWPAGSLRSRPCSRS